MLKNFNTFDRRVLIAAALMLLISSYFLYDDSLLVTWLAPHGIEVGALTLAQKSVRMKYAAQSQFIDVNHGKVHKGDTLFTGPSSNATVTLKNGSVIEISENSMVQFTTVGDQVIVDLLQGHAKSNSPGALILGDDQTRKPSSTDEMAPPRPVITSIKPLEVRKIRLTCDETASTSTALDLAWIYPKPDAQFEVQVAKDPNFDNVVFSDKTTETHLLTPQMKAGSNYARVREKDTGHGPGPWSKVVVVEFQFEKPPVVEGLATPKVSGDEATFVIGEPAPYTISWQAATGATNYCVEVDTSLNFEHPQKFKTTENSYTFKSLTPGHFFYRISSMNEQIEFSPVSENARFQAIVKSPTPNKVASYTYASKHGKDTPPPHTFSLTWKASPQTAAYAVTVADNPEGHKARRWVTHGLHWSLTVPGPRPIYWQVQALDKNQQEISRLSATSKTQYIFHGPLPAPALIEPLADFTLFFQGTKDNPFWFKWQNVTEAESYHLQVAKDADFKELVLDKSASDYRYLARRKFPQGALYWRVRAEASGERYSDWSTPRSLQIFGGRRPASERNGTP